MATLINNRKYDVIVIGAGPSGVSSAIICAKKGDKVNIEFDLVGKYLNKIYVWHKQNIIINSRNY